MGPITDPDSVNDVIARFRTELDTDLASAWSSALIAVRS
jgi:hypothetical protein